MNIKNECIAALKLRVYKFLLMLYQTEFKKYFPSLIKEIINQGILQHSA